MKQEDPITWANNETDAWGAVLFGQHPNFAGRKAGGCSIVMDAIGEDIDCAA